MAITKETAIDQITVTENGIILYREVTRMMGELPSKSGCFPLIVKVQSQAQPQVEQPKEEEAA